MPTTRRHLQLNNACSGVIVRCVHSLGRALLKALIGSVTEEALRSLNVDILAVPPAR
jgi:nucleotide-binding universal stress UspA family protein